MKDIKIDYSKPPRDIEKCETHALYTVIGLLQYFADRGSKEKAELAEEALEVIRKNLSDVLLDDENEKGAK